MPVFVSLKYRYPARLGCEIFLVSYLQRDGPPRCRIIGAVAKTSAPVRIPNPYLRTLPAV
jgi:hypothetical protein